MKFKNKLEALIACRNQWQFMEITGSDEKGDYEPSHDWDNGCACCDFVQLEGRFRGPDGCNGCPLVTYAWPATGYGCERRGSSFFKSWQGSVTIEQRQFWANRMVYACNQAIENFLLEEV